MPTPPIALKLQGANYEQVERAANELVTHLKAFDGVFEVESSANAGPEEIKLSIKPEAEALGITLVDLASQDHPRLTRLGRWLLRESVGKALAKVSFITDPAEFKRTKKYLFLLFRVPEG